MLLQSIIDERVDVVLQKKDDAKCLKKRYTKEMNVKMAWLFSQAQQQAALPPEQRLIMLKDICKAAGVQMGQYKVRPYLEEIKDEIEISYPQDILSIIAERKKNAIAGSSSANIQSEATPDPALPSAHNLLSTIESTLSSMPSSSIPLENSSALGK